MPRTRFYLLAALAFLAVGAGSWSVRELFLGLPPMAALEDYAPSLTTRVYDVKGNVVAELSIEKRALLESPRSAARLLLSHTMKSAESPDQIATIQGDHFASGEKPL